MKNWRRKVRRSRKTQKNVMAETMTCSRMKRTRKKRQTKMQRMMAQPCSCLLAWNIFFGATATMKKKDA